MNLEWHYSEDENPASPVIEVIVYDPQMKTKLALKARVDTGFSGTVLITPEQYIRLGLQSFEEPDQSFVGRGATGAMVSIVASRGRFNWVRKRSSVPSTAAGYYSSRWLVVSF